MKFRKIFSFACVWAATAVWTLSPWSQAQTFSGDLGLGGPATEQRTGPVEPAESQQDLSLPWNSSSTRELSLTPAPSAVLTGDSVDQSIPSEDHGLDGFDSFPVLNLTAVGYRSSPGVGLGVASNHGWVISQSFVLGRNLDLTLFYLDDAERRAKGLDEQSMEIGRAFGLRLSWSY